MAHAGIPYCQPQSMYIGKCSVASGGREVRSHGVCCCARKTGANPGAPACPRRATFHRMKFFANLLAAPLLLMQAHAQVFTFTHDEMLKYTSHNPFDRFEDGRPKVSDAILEKVKGLSAEEVWAVLPGGGFRNQYEGNWRILHPTRKLVGRAVAVQFMPARPDIADMATSEF